MERLNIKYKDAQKSLQTLQEIQRELFSIIIRDAAIKRFEYIFEAFWKFLQEYLKVKEGIAANSPKAVFRELFALKVVSEDQTVALLEMTDRRNDTVHIYPPTQNITGLPVDECEKKRDLLRGWSLSLRKGG